MSTQEGISDAGRGAAFKKYCRKPLWGGAVFPALEQHGLAGQRDPAPPIIPSSGRHMTSPPNYAQGVQLLPGKRHRGGPPPLPNFQGQNILTTRKVTEPLPVHGLGAVNREQESRGLFGLGFLDYKKAHTYHEGRK